MKKANLTMYDHLLMYTPSNSKRKPYRSTQIIATVPLSSDKDRIYQMIEAGMNIACFSVEKPNDELKVLQPLSELRTALKEYNESRRKEAELQQHSGAKVLDIKVHVATALDIQSDPIITGEFKNDFNFTVDNEVKLTTDKTLECTDVMVCIEVDDISSLSVDQVVIIDTGNERISIKVTNVDLSQKPADIDGKVVVGGQVTAGNKYKVYFPGAKIKVPNINVSKYCEFCKKNQIDMIMVPVNSPSIFAQIACIASADNSAVKLKVIAKVEGQEAVQNIDKIIERANGVMLSRINLGEAVLTHEKCIVYQKNVIAKCHKAGITSIVANHMLKGMEVDPQGDFGQPKKSEFADIVNAVLDGADCTMLDEKTSQKEAIETMCSVIMEAEDMINYRRLFREIVTQTTIPPTVYDFTETVAISACMAAMVNNANAIIALTDSGKTARRLSKYRPECPIIAVTKHAGVARQCLMARGVFSIVYEKSPEDFQKSVDERIQLGISFAKMTCLMKKLPGVVVAVMSSTKEPHKTDAIRIVVVEEEKKKATIEENIAK